MSNWITLSNVLSNYKGYDPVTYETIHFTDEERQDYFAKFREFVAKTARGDRRWRIRNTSIGRVRDYGILRRLYIEEGSDIVRYCCGQEWNSEMAILRDAFD